MLAQRVKSKDIRLVESTLLTIAAISIDASSDIGMFYNKALLEELFKRAD